MFAGASQPLESPVAEAETLSDDALLAAIALEDRDAFSVLMQRHMAPMMATATRIVLNRAEAHEIVQEAFLRVWRHAGDWDPNGSAQFSTWLYRIVANLSISQKRKHRPQVDLDQIAEMPSLEASAFDGLVEDQRKSVVREALAALPERQRAAVALYYYDDLPQKEAAAILKLSNKAYGSLLSRAKETLKKKIGSLLDQEDLL